MNSELKAWFNLKSKYSILCFYLPSIIVTENNVVNKAGFSLIIEVAGGYCKITGESGHSEKKI